MEADVIWRQSARRQQSAFSKLEQREYPSGNIQFAPEANATFAVFLAVKTIHHKMIFCIPCKQIQRDYSPELYISSFVLMKEMILPICASKCNGIMLREYALRHHVLLDLGHVKSRTSYSISLHVLQASATGHQCSNHCVCEPPRHTVSSITSYK